MQILNELIKSQTLFLKNKYIQCSCVDLEFPYKLQRYS